MRSLVHDSAGLIHLLTSLTALVLGTIVLFSRKGTRFHKTCGYGYVLSMVILNLTAFSIYHLFRGWGPFHYAAVLSSATLMMGFLPAFFRSRNWITWHVAGMYYSVIGLYAAFVSEVVTRIPGLPFFAMVSLGTAVVMVIGMRVFIRNRKIWMSYG